MIANRPGDEPSARIEDHETPARSPVGDNPIKHRQSPLKPSGLDVMCSCHAGLRKKGRAAAMGGGGNEESLGVSGSRTTFPLATAYGR